MNRLNNLSTDKAYRMYKEEGKYFICQDGKVKFTKKETLWKGIYGKTQLNYTIWGEIMEDIKNIKECIKANKEISSLYQKLPTLTWLEEEEKIINKIVTALDEHSYFLEEVENNRRYLKFVKGA